jgi:tetraacyldisaccharide 4'-kinase
MTKVLFFPVLWVLSLVYGAVVWLRRLFYRIGFIQSFELPGIVVSVGNIAVGGTGKSPVVIELCRLLRGKERPLIILARGYRSGLQKDQWQVLKSGKVVAGVDDPKIISDEAIMQSNLLPDVWVVVGANRYENAVRMLNWLKEQRIIQGSLGPIWILDDGFQHLRLRRAIDIVLWDASKDFDGLLPLGRFRETRAAMCRAHMVLFTKSVAGNQTLEILTMLQKIRPEIYCGSAAFEMTGFRLVLHQGVKLAASQDLNYAGRSVLVMSGLADNERFLRDVESKGATVDGVYFVKDHQAFEEEEIKAKIRKNSVVLTTEKDFARSEKLFVKLRLTVAVCPLKVTLPEPFVARLYELIDLQF